jgi:hypothetical protein
LGMWGGGLSIFQQWQGTTGVGYYASPQVKAVSSNSDIRWVSTDIVFEVGAII